MKKLITRFAAVLFTALTLSACQKTVTEPVSDELSGSELAQVRALGFSTDGAIRNNGGILVEGDILLSADDLKAAPQSPNLIIAKEEQYRTFNTVSTSKHPSVQVALNNSSSQHDAAFSAALDEAIKRYDALGITINLERVANGTAGTDITMVAYYEVSNTLGSAGFPTSTGDPYNQVRMNTYHYATGTDATNTNYIATIMAHEIGHCIGFRHTDYMDRSFSCGGRRSNEGQANNGVGAVHLTGTPTGPDAASWMLACIGKNVNRPFNNNDQTALKFLY